MKFYSWKLKWVDNEGTDPSNVVNDDKTHVSGHFAIGDVFYAICSKGQLNVGSLQDWQVIELTQEEFLEAARTISPTADIVDNVFTMPDERIEKP